MVINNNNTVIPATWQPGGGAPAVASWEFMNVTQRDDILDANNDLVSATYDPATKRNTVTISRDNSTDRTYPSQGAIMMFFDTGMTAQDLYPAKFRIRIYNHEDLQTSYAFLTVGLASQKDGQRFGTMGLDYQLATSQRNKRILNTGSQNISSVGNQRATGRGCIVHVTNNNGVTYGNVCLDTFATSVDSNGIADTTNQYNVSPSNVNAVNGTDPIYAVILFGYGNENNPLTQITYDFSIERTPFIKL